MQKRIVITGVNGYIGSCLAGYLRNLGYYVIGVDKNPQGTSIHCDLHYNVDFIHSVIRDEVQKADLVVHLAASSLIHPSLTDPIDYYDNNLAKSIKLLEYCNLRMTPMIFASTAAVYDHVNYPVHEYSRINPLTPYGTSKYGFEQVLESVSGLLQIPVTVFRFFNVAGANQWDGQDIDQPHLLTQISKAFYNRDIFLINGYNYDTPDGTPVRDFIHVNDICSAIAHQITSMLSYQCQKYRVYNLGTSKGYSILEVINRFKNIVNINIDYQLKSKRTGDPGYLVADGKMFAKVSGIQYSGLDSIIESHYHNYWNVRKQSLYV